MPRELLATPLSLQRFLLAVLVVLLPSLVSASVPKPAGIVTQVAGQATLHRVGLTSALPIKFKDQVFLQDKIYTQEHTFVRVLLGGKALVTVRELSVLKITEDLDHATIDIQSGIVGLSVARKRMKPGEYIEIRTPHVIAAVRGTTVLTQVSALTNMSVLEGFIDIASIATPTHTTTLNQLNTIQAAEEGLGEVLKMSNDVLALARELLKADEKIIPINSPLSDSVANNQSDQAAALAEALAPSATNTGLPLQMERSETPNTQQSQNSPIPSVLSTQELKISQLIISPNQTPTFNTGQPQFFETVAFSGGQIQGTDSITVTGTTTVDGGTNTVGNPFNNEGEANINEGSINFRGGGTHTGNFTIQSGTTLEFGGGTHDITGNVSGPGTVEISAGSVNLNGGTYNVTGNSTTVSGGIMTFNAGATLTSLGTLSLSGGLLNLLSAEAVSLPSFNFSGGTLDGTDTVTVTGSTTVNGAGTKTINTLFNNQGPLALQGGTLRLLGSGTHTGNFATQNGTTLEFGGGSHSLAGSSLSGPGLVSVTKGDLSTTGKLFSLSEDLTPLGTLFQQTDGITNIGSTGNSDSDALQVLAYSLDASGTNDALFNISGGVLTTEGGSSDLIEVGSGGGTVTTGGSAVAFSGTGSVTLKGINSSVLQSVGAGTRITTGNTAITISGNALLDLDDQTSNDVALLQSGGSIEADGSILKVSNSAEARVGRSVGKLESGGQLTTTNGGHVLESTGGTTNMGNSVLDLVGGTSQANISGYVVSATGGQINGPAGFNLVDVNDGELNTDGGIIKAEGDDRIVLDSGTTDAIVDITSSDGTHDLGTTSGDAIFHLSGASSSDTPLTKKDGSNNDIAVDQTLLASSGATSNTKQFLIVDQALLDASAPLLNLMDNAGTSSTMTADPGNSNGFIDLANQAVVRNNTNTMPLLTLDNSTLSLTTGHLLALNQSQLSVMGNFISLSNGSSLNLNSANGFLVSATGNSSLTITGAFINFGGTGGNTVTLTNTSVSETINTIPFFFTNGATNSQVTVNGTPIQNPGLGTITNGAGYIQVDGTQATVTIQGS